MCVVHGGALFVVVVLIGHGYDAAAIHGLLIFARVNVKISALFRAISTLVPCVLPPKPTAAAVAAAAGVAGVVSSCLVLCSSYAYS